MEFNSREYFDYSQNGITGKLTRGLVVSTEDPLYSGRVKVWIPTLHGGYYIDPKQDSDIDSEVILIDPKEGSNKLGNLKNQLSISCLPWAPVIGHNWGPTSDFSSPDAKSVFGIFNIPKVGTEVYIIFEDDNPDLPIVIGSVFHETELFQNSRIKSLEITPGTLISAELTEEDERNGYENRVSNSYVIQSENGSKLILSDLDGQEQISLGGTIGFFRAPYIIDDGDPSSKYTQFSTEFPNFPTTASAPFRMRKSIFTDNPILDKQVLRTKPVNSTSNKSTTTNSNQSSTTVIQATNISVTKKAPIDIAWPKIQKGTFKDFKYNRGSHIHLGVDLSVKLANLIAPIDCIPMAFRNSPSAGKMLLVKGVDGYCHCFLHLDSVLPEIIDNLNKGIYKKYSVGSKLGVTGNTGNVSGAGGGWHLHWEIFYSGDLVKTTSDIITMREILRKPGSGILKGITLKGVDFTGTYRWTHPLEEWLKSDILTTSDGVPVPTEITMSAAQLDSFSAVYNVATDSTYDKIIGIEMSLTPGAEHIFMRHSSGGFAGFDADGNWKVYTPGNAEYKINRSLTFDVLGGVITSCLAVYTRAKAVIKLMSSTKPRLLASIGNALDSKTDLPKTFTRIDLARNKDMEDALKQGTSNIYYNLSDSSLGKSLEDIQKDKYATTFVPSSGDERLYSIPTYDALIKKYTDMYASKHELSSILTSKLFKSIMLIESNGDPSVRNGDHVGLYQLSAICIKDILGSNDVINVDNYINPEDNIKIGIQYAIKCVDIMLRAVKKAGKQISSEDDKLNILLAALMGYNLGPYAVVEMYRNVVAQSNTLSYTALEERYVSSPSFRDETLRYAPHVMYILSKVTLN